MYRENGERADRSVRLKLTGDRNQCPSCNLNFNSSRAFEKHRFPVAYNFNDDFEQNKSKPAYPHRCLSETEMKSKGMAVNSAGFWVTALMSENTINNILKENS